MKVKENITVFQCDFCKKKLFRKYAMEKHEEHCGNNPKNHSACVDCKFLKQGEESFEYNDSVMWSKTFFCEKLNKGVYPHKVIKKNLLERFPGTFENQIKMPTKCEHFKGYWS